MITQETAGDIWNCYREMAAAEKLLQDMAEARENEQSHEKHLPTLRDAFGRKRQLQLGVPTGDSCHRLFDVHPQLADSVIRAHIAEKQAELIRCNERARIELSELPAATPKERKKQ